MAKSRSQPATVPPPAPGGLAGFHRLAVLAASITYLALLAGASVTSTGSGLAVPDWPLSYGRLFPRMTGGVLFEHGHRMVAGLVLLVSAALAIWAWRKPVGRDARILATAALALVLVQALLGGLTVLLFLPTGISVAHAGLAMLVFGLLVATAVTSGPAWRRAGPGTDPRLGGLAASGAAVTALVYGQILLGAVMRHIGAGLACPDFPTCHGAWIPPLESFFVAVHFWHRVGGVLAALAVWGLAAHAWRRAPDARGLRRLGLAASLLVAFQFGLGVAAVLTRLAPAVTVLHHAGGAALLALVLLQALWAYRLRGPAPRAVLSVARAAARAAPAASS
jgi:heme A synthase